MLRPRRALSGVRHNMNVVHGRDDDILTIKRWNDTYNLTKLMKTHPDAPQFARI